MGLVKGHAVQDGLPQVGDLQLGGLGGPADVLGEVVDLLLDGPHGQGAEAEAAQTGGGELGRPRRDFPSERVVSSGRTLRRAWGEPRFRA